MSSADTDIVIVLTTVPPGFDVEALARRLLEARLVACVSVWPGMRSIYRWHGAVEMADERQVLLKTRRVRLAELEAALTEAHPYDVPELLVLPVTGGSPGYLGWVEAETAPAE
jgi:periplasmic divalent cation tolerance protein